jgi:hypothetical protein
MRRTLILGTAMTLTLAMSLGAAPHIPSAWAATKSATRTGSAAPNNPSGGMKSVERTKGKVVKEKARKKSNIICTEAGTQSGVQGTLNCRPK